MATIKHVSTNISAVYGLIGFRFGMVVASNFSQHILGAQSDNCVDCSFTDR